jgi:hypothetical protein
VGVDHQHPTLADDEAVIVYRGLRRNQRVDAWRELLRFQFDAVGMQRREENPSGGVNAGSVAPVWAAAATARPLPSSRIDAICAVLWMRSILFSCD